MTTPQPNIELGTRVRFVRQLAGFRVNRPAPYDYGGTDDGYLIARTSDPTDSGRVAHDTARARYAELTEGAPGTYRVVATWDVPPRQQYDLRKHDEGIVVGRTFRYEGRVEYDEGWMIGVVGIGKGYPPARRVECWKVQQTLTRRPVLVPLDAVEVLS